MGWKRLIQQEVTRGTGGQKRRGGKYNLTQQTRALERQATPRLRRGRKAWVRAGGLGKGGVPAAEAGGPQGGVLAPLLVNVALHGMEREAKAAMRPRLLTWDKEVT